jgi:GTP-binding protein
MTELELPSAAGATPVVAIVGRPNVGKSTLFNRLLGRRQSIVHNQPGVTRDRITGAAEITDGRSVELVDTGGLVPGDDPIGLNEQVFLAVEESDLLVLVVDGKEGLVTADLTVWQEFRRRNKPTVLAVNKSDTKEAQARFGDFHRLGIPEPVLISSEHGLGIEELRERIVQLLPPPTVTVEAPAAPPVAIVGRPNVGKSSLLNRLVGEARTLVSPIAGTTRDPIDTLVELDGSPFLLIDTAGIRRRSQVTGAAEELAVMMARRQIERAEIAILVVDAAAGVTTGDMAIAGSIWEQGRAAVVAVNKWDLLDEEGREQLDLSWVRLSQLLANPRRVNLSALTGRSLAKLGPLITATLKDYHLQLPTSEVNQLLEDALRRTAPPSMSGAAWKFYYATQVSTAPPTFMVFANRTLPLHHGYRRYLQNRMRETLGLPGVPLRLVIRRRT